MLFSASNIEVLEIELLLFSVGQFNKYLLKVSRFRGYGPCDGLDVTSTVGAASGYGSLDTDFAALFLAHDFPCFGFYAEGESFID